MTGGAVHQGLAARIPAYEYAHPDDLLDRAAGDGREAADRGARPGHRPAQPRRRRPQRRGVRRARRRDPRAPGRRHDRLGLEDQRRRRRPDPGRPDRQPGPRSSRTTRTPAAWSSAWPPTATSTCPTSTSPTGPLVLVVGSEGDGLSRLVAETCDQLRLDPDGQPGRVPQRRRRRARSRSTRWRSAAEPEPCGRGSWSAAYVRSPGCCSPGVRGRGLPAQQPRRPRWPATTRSLRPDLVG